MSVRGAGTTSATNSIVFQNSSGGTMALMNNAGNLLIGTSTDNGYRLVVETGGLFVKGGGATSSTNSLLIQNSSSTSLFQVRNDGRVSNGDSTFYTDRYSAGGTSVVISNGGHNGATGIQVTSAVGIKAYSNLGVSVNNSLGASIYAAGGTSGSNISLGLLSNRALISASNGLSMNNSSMLQVDSTTQGFLQPRMTTSEKNAISLPATGLTVYDTTLNTNEYYDGAAWRSIASQAWVQSQGYLTGFTEGDTLQIVSDRGRVTTSLSSTGTTLVASATTGYTGVFFNYTLGDGTSYRAGTVTSVVSSGSTVEFTETSTNDIGNTSSVSLSVGVGGGFINLSATTTTTGWTIKVVPQGI
jgi:hypothetical protein